MNYTTFLKNYYTEKKINIKDYFTSNELNTIHKLIKTIKDELYTYYEFEIMACKLFKYYIDVNEMTEDELKEVLPLEEKNVTQEEYDSVMKKIEKIYSEIF